MKIKIFLLLFLSSCHELKRDCNFFRTGTFTTEIITDEEVFISNFERSENLQIETFKGVVDSVSVRWINNCEMVLTKLNPKNMNEKKSVLIKILQTTNSSYSYEYSFLGEKKKGKAVAHLVN